MTLSVTVEFHGVPAIPIKSKKLIFSCEQIKKATVEEVIKKLLIIEPQLDGKVIDSDKNLLLSSYLGNINGDKFIEGNLDEMKDGDSLIVIPRMAGG
ncbi:MAG: MoaD/ThiS family protein [SAR202 cluster bacterium]|jgi:molybdopterin converting factor small subunit|nr:hypothetical protein [SAR202 cluster bacterium]MEC7884680.1 hypothetical protein [Chloroflexota bacterium]MED5429202.1 hypothetical protein [Chloroflexota bacterium]MQG75314.1 MoaD/ThiS family protein [SAR202 cluster bacterium]|tara:strand:- start:550 stop:840 length:291 start_codon:yes stop_codon:yes gene_type:complete